MRCEKCGTELEDNAQYCHQCGAPVAGDYRVDLDRQNTPAVPPPNYLWQSIVVTVLCCLPFGVVGIVYASKVDGLFLAGHVAEAYQASRQAKTWTIVGLCTGLVALLIYICMIVFGTIGAGLLEYMDLD